MRATLTDEMDAPKFVYEARDALMTKLAEVRAAIPNEFTVLNPDMRQITDVVRALDAGAKAAENRLTAAARKLGLKPRGAPDLSSGIHCGMTGSIEFWYQITAE